MQLRDAIHTCASATTSARPMPTADKMQPRDVVHTSSSVTTSARPMPTADKMQPRDVVHTCSSVTTSARPMPTADKMQLTDMLHTCSSATTSARPMPTADRMPEYLWMKMVFMPRERAIAQACCPPAPPKHASACAATSYPFIWVRALMGRHMVSFATLMNPMATWGYSM